MVTHPFSISGSTYSSNTSQMRSSQSPSNTQYSQSEHDQTQETIEEKKERLFKWNYYQRIKIPNEYIKKVLIQDVQVLRFIGMFESINQIVMGWGSNKNYQLGINIVSNWRNFYQNKRQSKNQKLEEIFKNKGVSDR